MSDDTTPAPHPIAQVLEARTRDLGDGFVVRRVLPAHGRRTVGPFVFFDHMGPVDMAPGGGVDVRPHPHIALATVTYLFSGEIFHRDSLGSAQAIVPGDVNWMVAGRGIVHSERTRDALRATGQHLHGLQAWVALPTDAEEGAPTFHHHPSASLPQLRGAGFEARVIAGSALGATSPVVVASPTLYMDISLDDGATFDVPNDYPERALYVASGAITCGDATYAPGHMLVLADAPVTVRASAAARVMLLGGAPLGERFVEWNFVASSRERIEQAKADWRAHRFPLVPGDEYERIPLPGDAD